MNLESMTCKVCKKIYNSTSRQPQFMACGHPICLKCFDQHEKQQIKKQDEKYQCPIKESCHQTQISKNVAVYLLEMLEESEIFNIFCDKHPKNTAQYFCKQENLLICETCMLTDHSNHLKPQAHVHFNCESKNIFTSNILPQIREKKKKLDTILARLEQSQENEIIISATQYKNLISETTEVLIGNLNDQLLAKNLDLSNQQILPSQAQQPQNKEEKYEEREIKRRYHY
eukprot:403343710